MVVRRIQAIVISVLAMVVATTSARAAPTLSATSVPGLTRFTLENGLEVFVLERHDAPIARIQLTFRCGGLTQTSETAGLFHFHEHMLFKGNALTATEGDFQAALAALGAVDANGGTGEEKVSYRCTVPAANVRKALDLWAAAVLAPTFDAEAIEREKPVLSGESAARLRTPDAIFEAAVTRRLLRLYPWRADLVGNPETHAGVTAQSLRALHETWYVPNNAMLFVGGDVDPETIAHAAQASFSAWKAGPDPWKAKLPPQATPGVTRPQWLVLPDASMPAGYGEVELRYRAPDTLADPDGARLADLFAILLDNPDGKFKRALLKTIPGIVAPDHIVPVYFARRDGASMSIRASFRITEGVTVAEVAQRFFKEQVRGIELFQMTRDPGYFTKQEIGVALQKLEDDRAIARETVASFADAFSFWWAAASGDYYFNAVSALKSTTVDIIQAFVRRYFMKNLEITALRVNPEDFERDKTALARYGFELITPDNAFWWKKK